MAFTRKPAQAFETTPRPPIAILYIKSDQLAGLGYDAATSTLAAMFRPQQGNTAAIYHYPGISAEDAEKAPVMTGTQFRAMIKGVAFKKYPAEACPLPPEVDQ